jgi:2-hydroxycyclohexanecarboxyl-CoA dehydrogenase
MSARFDFDGQVFAFTGGANGIGAAAARACAEAGAHVLILDVDDAAGNELVQAGAGAGSLEYIHLDVSDRGAVHRTFSDIVERHGRIDGLVCAAILQPLVSVVDIDEDVWRRVMDVNINGVVWCCQAVLPTMIRQDAGSIVLFVSGTADMGKARSSPYTTSKGATAGFAKTLARETAGTGVRVNTCRPGIIDTPQFRAANPGMDTARMDKPEDVVGPVLFLLSSQATMTGSTVTREMPYSVASAALAGKGAA